LNRREFVKTVGIATAGLCIGTPVSSLAHFPYHNRKTLSDEMPGLTVRVIGIGSAGCNMLDHILKEDLKNVDFIGASLDATFLEERPFPSKILLGESLGNPCGLGCDPALAYTYSMASRETIRRRLEGSDVAIILAGMGGVTSAGGSPVVAQIAKELGIWTIGIVTVPFSFEKRTERAQQTTAQLESIVDMVIVIPNDAVRPYLEPSSSFFDALIQSNAIVYQAVKAFSDILLTPHMLAMDFTDIKRTFPQGLARIGIGMTKERRPIIAVREAILSPFFEGISLEKARKVVCNMNLSGNETIEEIDDAFCLLRDKSHKDVDLLLNTQIDQKGKTVATLIVANFEPSSRSLSGVLADVKNKR